MMDTCHSTCVQTHRTYNAKPGLWVIVMCQCRFTEGNKWSPPVGDVDSGRQRGAVRVGGQRAREKPLSLPLDFNVNLKLL